MKAFRFIRRHTHSDWLEIIFADNKEEAIELYDYKDEEYEIGELENRKGCVLAFHITGGQGKYGS